jgi:hypothetical protein
MCGYLVIGHGMADGFGCLGPGRGRHMHMLTGNRVVGRSMGTNIGGTRDTGGKEISESN